MEYYELIPVDFLLALGTLVISIFAMSALLFVFARALFATDKKHEKNKVLVYMFLHLFLSSCIVGSLMYYTLSDALLVFKILYGLSMAIFISFLITLLALKEDEEKKKEESKA